MISLGRKPRSPAPPESGVLAEYRSAAELLQAARTLRDHGYRRLEAFSPFPIHGMDDALQIRPSILPWLVLIAGVVGGVSALAFQWWTNTIDYPYLVSGKPMFSLPANIPVMFEVTILLAAFAAFFGMLLINGLPRLHNPLLQNERFARVSNDGFFLLVAPEKDHSPDQTAEEVVRQTAPVSAEPLAPPEDEVASIPRGFVLTGIVLASLAVLPPLMITKARSSTSDKPRLHNFFDMDFQPKFKSQTASAMFADGRSMRPRPVGAIPRGARSMDPRVKYGIESVEAIAQELERNAGGAESPLIAPPAAAPELNEPAMDNALVNDAGTNTADSLTPEFVARVPVSVTDRLMRQGQLHFNIHCAVCHGKAGYGNGLASQRALQLEQGTWVPPTNLHSAYLLEQPDGQIFNSITNGVRKMPAYGHQISVEDRWAIVAYVRALQRSQSATIGDVPEELRQSLREFN
ncbi:MAG: quinol:electron acceptor oxidoreductase subunit ActD [Planctomycetota bacterium]